MALILSSDLDPWSQPRFDRNRLWYIWVSGVCQRRECMNSKNSHPRIRNGYCRQRALQKHFNVFGTHTSVCCLFHPLICSLPSPLRKSSKMRDAWTCRKSPPPTNLSPWWKFFVFFVLFPVADPIGGGTLTLGLLPPLVQFISFSYSFRQTFCQIIDWRNRFVWGWRPSHLWEVLDPPLISMFCAWFIKSLYYRSPVVLAAAASFWWHFFTNTSGPLPRF